MHCTFILCSNEDASTLDSQIQARQQILNLLTFCNAQFSSCAKVWESTEEEVFYVGN